MKRLAVLGKPIAHSRSPAIHNAALAELGLAGEWSYEAIEVSREDFAARVRAMAGEGFAGANVTVPHKVSALELADRASDAARAIGAANTLSFAGGRIAAENTDAAGFLEALPRSPRGLHALVLGAGGSARAVVWSLVTNGAEVRIWNRTASKAERLAADLGGSASPQSERPLAASDFELIVNATTVGMGASTDDELGASTLSAGTADLKALPIDADALGETELLVDLAYGGAETELSRAARRSGITVVDGLEVLVRQGAASLRIWTGLDPPIETMRRAARATWPPTSAPDT